VLFDRFTAAMFNAASPAISQTFGTPWGTKTRPPLVASGGSNFIRFSPIDSILNLEDSRGSTLHLSRCDRRHRRLSLVFALRRLLAFLDGRIFSTILGDSREDDARVEPPPARAPRRAMFLDTL